MKSIIHLIFILLLPSLAIAHNSSTSYLYAEVQDSSTIALRWDISLEDLQHILNLDNNNDGNILWQEIERKQTDIFAYTHDRLVISSQSGDCSKQAQQMKVDTHNEKKYIALFSQVSCNNITDTILFNYQLLFDIDSQHQGLLRLNKNNADISYVFTNKEMQKEFVLNNQETNNSFLHFIKEGVWHIWIGYDHILFLLSLLLPAVLIRKNQAWEGVHSLSSTLTKTVKIVTAFTIAHSITLTLVMLGLLSLPASWVEATIAFSVTIVALNNLYPIITKKLWLLALFFGLIHGVGFANVLSELELQQATLIPSLIGFNIGVELGQLVIVFLFIPLAFYFRHSMFYKNYLFKWGSAAIAIIGLVWIVERVA